MKPDLAVIVNMGVFVETGLPAVTVSIGKETIGVDPATARRIADHLLNMATKIEAITADGHQVLTLARN